ncbi:hypothetical protein [uncultured Paludibaculum sp.]|uniref:hypothetical protein n=1 Tax=uncultured Paludibaculum sp. TaxID=1765020 RepID=UPI002AAB3F5C|nr:hypothetical protein [uncultured Paludibaculum sp.]
MKPPVTTQELLASEATFLAAMQQLGFGRFEYLQIRGGELMLNPWPVTVRDIKFATPPNTGRPSEPNFELRPQVAEFFAYVRDVEAGEIRELDVRHGLPFSMEIELQGGRRG